MAGAKLQAVDVDFSGIDADIAAHESAVLGIKDDPRPVLRLSGEIAHRRVADALVALGNAGEVYDRGGELVTFDKSGRLYAMTPPRAVIELTRAIRFEKYLPLSREWGAIKCPAEFAAEVLSMRGRYDGVRKLRAVITAPTMTAAGRMIDKAGYDESTELLLLPAGNIKPSEPVGVEDAKAALEFIWELFDEFPFVGPIDRGVHLAALLSTAVRLTVGKIPAFGYSATAAGTGKTLLASCISVLCGDNAEASNYCRDEEENAKSLLSFARSGRGSILIDNVSGNIDSDSYCSYLTSSHISRRILGSSVEVTAPADALLLFTGNNLTPAGDLNRRVLVCNLDAQCARPYAREFRFDPLSRCRAERLQLIDAALTVLRAYLQRPAGVPPGVAGFEAWSNLVRGAVIWIKSQRWLDVDDPAASIDRSYALDPETALLGGLLQSWRATYQSTPKKLADVAFDAGGALNDSDKIALRDVLREIAGDDKGSINVRRLGRWTARNAGRVHDGLRIVRAGVSGGIERWRVERVETA